MDSPLLKIQLLKDNPPKDFGKWSKENLLQLDKWEKELEKIAKTEAFYEYETTRKLVDNLIEQIKNINGLLLDKNKRDEVDFLFATKEAFLWVLKQITGGDYSIRKAQIEKDLDAEIKRFKL